MRSLLTFRKMSSNLHSIRMKYRDCNQLFLENDVKLKDPYAVFKEWIELAVSAPEIHEPNAAALATVDKDGRPSNRFVLLKDYSDKGFTFFTNYESRKAKDIEQNSNVAMTIYWYQLHRSVRIEGKAEKVPVTESVNYFRERPLDSQISASASPQSQPIPSRDTLTMAEVIIKQNLSNIGEVPMPNWGGYIIIPCAIEFWQGQSNRMHDRIRFRKGSGVEKEVDGSVVHQGENGWVYERLAP